MEQFQSFSQLLYSQRVFQRMLRPTHLITGQEKRAFLEGNPESTSHSFLLLKLDPKPVFMEIMGKLQGDHFEQLFYYFPLIPQGRSLEYRERLFGPALAFVDGLFAFARGKSAVELRKIVPREVENFLRDHNSQRAYPPESCPEEDLLPIIEEIIKLLNSSESTKGPALPPPLVCQCFKLNYQQIENILVENNLHSPEELAELTYAGTRCGACKTPGKDPSRIYFLDQIISQVNLKREMNCYISPHWQEERQKSCVFNNLPLYRQQELVENLLQALIKRGELLPEWGMKLEMISGNELAFSFEDSAELIESQRESALQKLKESLISLFNKENIHVGLFQARTFVEVEL